MSPADREHLTGFFSQYGVPVAVQEELIKSFEQGYVWDSLTPGTEAVSSEQSVQGRDAVTVDRYADGSIAVSAVSAGATEVSESAIQPRGVYACSRKSGGRYATYWKGCRADVNLGLIRQGFYFDYQNVRGSGAKITRYWGAFHHIVGGSLSNHRLVRFSNTNVRYSADLRVAYKDFPAGWTSYMGVKVKGNTATTYHN